MLRQTVLWGWIAAVFTAVTVAFVSWLDATCFFELWGPLRYWAWGAYALVLLPLWSRFRSAQALGVVASIWMLVVLPSVRWNHAKSFYVDARRIHLGMPAEEVRRIMAGHMEVGVSDDFTDEERSWVMPRDRGAMVFVHCALGWTDHCEVQIDARSQVSSIYIEKD